MHLDVLKKQNRSIFKNLNFFSDFYLAGGTALALQIGHRISVDFDLFNDQEISKTIYNKAKNVFSDYTFRPLVNNKEELTILVNKVKITFLCYPFKVLRKFTRFQGVKLLSIQEIAATKAYTIGRRGAFKDYVDLYFIILKQYSTIEKIINLAEKKYQQEFNSRLFLEQLVYLDDIDDVDVAFLSEKVNKDELCRFFEDQARKIKMEL